MIRVAIFEDDKTFADNLRLVLVDNDDYHLVGTFPNAIRAVERVAHCRPDVVIMDIKMPDVSGIEAAGAIKATYPGIQILMQTVFEDDDKVFAAICAGASGYLLKGTPPDKLLEAITDVYMGGTPLSPGVGRKVFRFFQEQQAARPEFYDLSKREKEILAHLVDGNSYKMIADVCGISVNTVNAHLRKIYEKLHVNSSQEAISKALRQKLA
ncbi:response regulator transcription factor [Fibrella forsythiae]|uniref:Response regulator transcription factor n=1 Tax=Fibrella forsythiae TaxID=2817061 RepID=A0ABS3JQN3_9BACT|nr:response regulator transcription factor [Fibrella forsythiae]MBO0951242.1 response regulator transcription factor [Fibrella forsythiae]